MDELTDSMSRQRVLDWAAAGITFKFITVSAPDDLPWNLISDTRHAVLGIEFATRIEKLERLLNCVNNQAGKSPVKLSVTKIHTSADEKRTGSKFAHNVSSGLVYQINLDDDLDRTIRYLIDAHRGSGIDPVFNIRFAMCSPAEENFDDDMIAERVKGVLALAREFGDLEFQFDTFIDIDRGYSPRHGLIDRSSNLRSAGKILAFERRW